MSETKRDYKDTMFRLLFKEPKDLLTLYNAVNGTNYTDVEGLEINTLENAIYMNVKNDVSFVFDFRLNLYEHQSTVNPNIPLRDLFYASKVLQKMVRDKELYSRTMKKIPTPKFVVFYNGVETMPERCEYRLSNMFEKPVDRPELELIVTVLNINLGMNEKLLESCSLLKEYMLYVTKVRENQKTMDVDSAVSKAVDDCIREEILKEFLERNKAEAIMVSIFEYNEEEHLKSLRDESVAEGIEVGKELGLKGIVNSLKPYLTNFEELYEAVIKNEGYENITKEQVKQLL